MDEGKCYSEFAKEYKNKISDNSESHQLPSLYHNRTEKVVEGEHRLESQDP